MPTTPDRPDGRSAGSGDEQAPAEAAEPAVDGHETVRVDVTDRPTVQLDPGHRRTVKLDRGERATVKLPGQRRPADRAGRAPLIVAAGFAALWAALLSYLPVAAVIGLARTLAGAGGLGGAAGGGLAAWLLGHGVPLGTAIGPLSLAPLLLTLLAVWRLNRAGLHVTRAIGARHSASPRAALLVAGAVGLWYAVFGALAALIADSPGLTVPAGRTALHFLVIGTAGTLVGSLRSTDAPAVLARRIPPALRHGVRTGLVAGLLVLAAGAGCTGLSVAVGGGEAADMIAAYRTGVAGQAGITLVSLAYGGNAAVWAAAYLLGPGFALGTDSTVRITEVTVGPLPTLPLLSGLPEGPVGALGALLLAVPVAAAMCAGWLLTRRIMRDRAAQAVRSAVIRPAAGDALPPWSLVLGAAVTAGPVAGLVLGALALVSGGSLGGGRLSAIGPVPWQVGLIAAAVVAAGAVAGAAAARTFVRRP